MAEAGIGTLLKIGDGGSPETFTAIAEVLDITGPNLSTDTEDGTHQQSPGGFEEVVPTILRTGEVTFTIQFLPTHATHNATTGLVADWKNKTLRNFQLVFSDPASTTWAFAAYVTGFQPQSPVGGKRTADVTLKVTGQPTLA